MDRTTITRNDAATLDDLLTLIGDREDSLEEYERIEDYVDICDLPSYGGADPDDTHEIYSWDADRLLVCDTVQFGAAIARRGCWQIIPR